MDEHCEIRIHDYDIISITSIMIKLRLVQHIIIVDRNIKIRDKWMPIFYYDVNFEYMRNNLRLNLFYYCLCSRCIN